MTSGASYQSCPTINNKDVFGLKPYTSLFRLVLIESKYVLFNATCNVIILEVYGQSRSSKIQKQSTISTVQFFRLDNPLVQEYYTIDIRSFVLNRQNSSLQKADINFGSRSNIILIGIPQSKSKSIRTSTLAYSSTVYVLCPRINSDFLLCLQVTVSIVSKVSCPLIFYSAIARTSSSLVIKSITIMQNSISIN